MPVGVQCPIFSSLGEFPSYWDWLWCKSRRFLEGTFMCASSFLVCARLTACVRAHTRPQFRGNTADTALLSLSILIIRFYFYVILNYRVFRLVNSGSAALTLL